MSGKLKTLFSLMVRTRSLSAVTLFVFIFLGFSLFVDNFFSFINFNNILLQSSILAILSLGMSLVMLTNGIDLSLGSMVSLVCVLIGFLSQRGLSLFSILAVILACCVLLGILKGIIISYAGLPPFIVTFAFMVIVASLALVISGGNTLYWEKNGIEILTCRNLAGIPVCFILVILLAFFVERMLSDTSFGFYLYALGSNEESLKLAGVNDRRIRVSAYAITSIFGFVAGVVMASRISSGNPIIGTGIEFEAVAAAVIGGITFVGGKGKPVFGVLSAVTITMMLNGLSLLGFNTAWQYCSIGVLLILGMSINSMMDQLIHLQGGAV